MKSVKRSDLSSKLQVIIPPRHIGDDDHRRTAYVTTLIWSLLNAVGDKKIENFRAEKMIWFWPYPPPAA